MTQSLEDKIEAAEGASYALDCEIWDLIYPGERKARFDKLTAKGQPYHTRLGPADMDGYIKPLRSFTSSLDAAMTLVLGGFKWSVTCSDGAYYLADTWADQTGDREFASRGATPALALCAAALRARAGEG